MKRNLAIVLVALVTAIAVPSVASGAPSELPDAAYSHNVCGPPAAGTARCHAKVVDVDAGGPGRAPTPKASPSPSGLTVANIRTAYGFATSGGSGKTIAIVDAYDNPTAIQDLATFDSAMGLGPCGCTITKVNQSGGSTYPSFNQGWALEIALDVQWAHAVAPNANILLVEANSNSYTDLFAAVDYANSHADYVSMSWGSPEFSGETVYDSHFLASGVSYFVSAGDNGTPAEYPSSSPNVLSIGGTKLTFNASKSALVSETGWTDGGGGCSLYETATSSQSTFTGYPCANSKRATPDISLDADPASGVSVYMGTPYNGSTGWLTVGGTSASAPMIAGRAALTGGPVNASTIYALTSASVRDITSGNNGAACLVGFDLCTGRGSWADNASTVPATTTTTAAPTTTTAPTSSTTSTTVATTNVHVGTLSYALTQNRKGFTVTVPILRDSNNSGVSGATVSVQIKKGSTVVATGSATTGSNGMVTFRLNSASAGTYSTVVTTIAPSSFKWNGATPSNTFTKN